MTCERCLSNVSAKHAATHVEKSLLESSMFETALALLVEKIVEEQGISRESALNIALEDTRDAMRKKPGHEDFLFDRREWTDMSEEDEEDE